MENALIARLQADIAYLNQILKVLIVENAEIKAEIAHLKSWVGIPEAEIAHPKSYIGNTEAENAHPKSYMGNTEAEIAHPKSYMGNTEAENAYPKSYMGNTEAETTLPEIITEASGIKIKLMQCLISQKAAGGNRQAINATAQLIIHIYNKKPCSYAALQKITSLSQFGIAKRIRAMKKEGFIINNGYQNFALTAKALQLLRQAVAG